ncbi:hypothetical protein GGS23DRAFT_439790 [Durotheca rogersii]|uniref:uncharacterized protein n=1 Tax=Durotheca rogersii TaxID=419775 RepID=UPI0022206571|nr:uncharacterized protein GGS23DRAFT_439790 [Durotheca rogersii]KAI5855581.1 hypothetical protein GGS23DRAFT_439790 [Durotheca rogersii]
MTAYPQLSVIFLIFLSSVYLFCSSPPALSVWMFSKVYKYIFSLLLVWNCPQREERGYSLNCAKSALRNCEMLKDPGRPGREGSKMPELPKYLTGDSAAISEFLDKFDVFLLDCDG